jgi:predicted double-glycine peptidase
MALTALRKPYTETELAKVMGSYPFGTPASHVIRLQTLGYQVRYAPMTLTELQQLISQGLTPIVFVLADFLPWADFIGFHALLLVGVTNDQVWLHDPALPDGPMQLSVDGFMLAWEEFDRMTAVISLRA